MEVKVTGPGEVTVLGDIESIDDYQKIKETVKGVVLSGNKSIVVKIPDAKSMTSMVIGFFLKLVKGDHLKITMLVKDETLYSILKAMKLIAVLDVHKM
ncbi:MAG: hypothetical protein HQL08_08395 [Nitrospirae bacterium]|nr:hypothetical protein [Nitrospirota bacterium]